MFFRAVSPLFFGGFSPCVRLFRGGWDTYPTPVRKAAHRGDSGFYFFYRSEWYVFYKCISSYKPGFPKCRNDFWTLLSVPQQRQKSYLQHLRSYYGTAAVKEKLQVFQQVFRFCNTCNTSTSTRHCPGFSQPYPCTTTPHGHCFRFQFEQALCSASARDRSDFPLPMPAAGLCT